MQYAVFSSSRIDDVDADAGDSYISHHISRAECHAPLRSPGSAWPRARRGGSVFGAEVAEGITVLKDLYFTHRHTRTHTHRHIDLYACLHVWLAAGLSVRM